jgi:hypothetical protein
MHRLLVFFPAILLFSGCGTSVPPTVVSVVTESEQTESAETGYRNTRFGYVLEVPEGLTLFALTSEQTAVPADGESDVVFLVESETNFFTVRGIEGTATPHEWITQNLSFFYPTGDAAQQVGEIDGVQAIFLRGAGTATSPARLIVLSREGKLIVISYEQETELFRRLVETLELI